MAKKTKMTIGEGDKGELAQAIAQARELLSQQRRRRKRTATDAMPRQAESMTEAIINRMVSTIRGIR